MKSKVLCLIGAAALFCFTSLQAATSTPVGYVTLSINAGWNALSNPLEHAVEQSGTASAVSGDTITTSFSGMTPSAYAGSDPNGDATYYIQTSTGVILDIVANTADSVTVANNSGNVVQDANITLKKYSTIGDLLSADNSLNLVSSDTLGASDAVYVMAAEGGTYATYFYRTDPTTALFGMPLDGGDGWRKVGDNTTDQAGVVIGPDDGILINAAGPLSRVVVGTVNTTPNSKTLPAGFSLISYPFPVDATLGEIGLDTSTGWTSGDTLGTSDAVYIIDSSGNFDTYFYRTDPTTALFGMPLDGGDGWRTVGDNTTDQAGVALPVGGAVIIKTLSSLTWTDDLPYTL